MGKKQKASNKSKSGSMDKMVNRVTSEFEKTSSQIERMINDSLKQLDQLQKQVQEPVKKLMDDVEKLGEREIKRLQGEFDKRVNDFNELQQSLKERIGLKAGGATKGKKSAPKKSTAKPAAKKTTAKPAAKKPAAKKAAAKKPTAAAKTPPAKAGNPNDLTRIKGVGPATADKMRAKGISSISQVANPTAADEEKLAEFAKLKSFSSWQAEAKKLV